MGIDIYLEWEGQTEPRETGATGYLRESYHGGPYATRILLREAFEADTCRAKIPAAILRERLTHVTEQANTPNMGHDLSMMMFALMTRAAADGKDLTVPQHAGLLERDTTCPMTVEEAVEARERTVYKGTDQDVQESLKEFRDFVALAEQKEAEHNKPCIIHASY